MQALKTFSMQPGLKREFDVICHIIDYYMILMESGETSLPAFHELIGLSNPRDLERWGPLKPESRSLPLNVLALEIATTCSNSFLTPHDVGVCDCHVIPVISVPVSSYHLRFIQSPFSEAHY